MADAKKPYQEEIEIPASKAPLIDINIKLNKIYEALILGIAQGNIEAIAGLTLCVLLTETDLKASGYYTPLYDKDVAAFYNALADKNTPTSEETLIKLQARLFALKKVVYANQEVEINLKI